MGLSWATGQPMPLIWQRNTEPRSMWRRRKPNWGGPQEKEMREEKGGKGKERGLGRGLGIGDGPIELSWALSFFSFCLYASI